MGTKHSEGEGSILPRWIGRFSFAAFQKPELNVRMDIIATAAGVKNCCC